MQFECRMTQRGSSNAIKMRRTLLSSIYYATKIQFGVPFEVEEITRITQNCGITQNCVNEVKYYSR